MIHLKNLKNCPYHARIQQMATTTQNTKVRPKQTIGNNGENHDQNQELGCCNEDR